MKRSLLLLLVMVCFIIETSAQIIHIPSDFSTIQAGIESSDNGDTVLVAEGTYFENINFKGKAITVASQFILDGDTSHISKTIIDGSKSTNPDTASVVTMWSGEDTTSVLMGFTITGGTGTNHAGVFSPEIISRSGGGVLIIGCGGKITDNIIKANHVKKIGSQYPHFGGGIRTMVYNNHSVIIRKNIIKDNQVTGPNGAFGGGMTIGYGRVICEYNEITNNKITAATEWSGGGGIRGIFLDEIDGVEIEGVIKEAIIRNNIISGNDSYTAWELGGGGGYFQEFGYGEKNLQFYNNIICNNGTNCVGGGLYLGIIEGSFFSNTIIDNTAGWDGNCIAGFTDSKFALYNNIMWRDVSSTKNEFYWFFSSDTARMLLSNNILMQNFGDLNHTIAINNSYNEPIFQYGSYKLAENSPGIGWGIDTLEYEGTWYYAPSTDIKGNIRPNPIDSHVDLGAYESPFEKSHTGINKYKQTGLSIYPNPANDLLTIETEQPDYYSIKITSLNGQLIYSTTVEGETHQIDMSRFSKGVYFITVRSKDFVRTEKIIKL